MKSKRLCPICETSDVQFLHSQRFELPEGHPLSAGYDIVTCSSCGFVFADTTVAQADYDKFYAEHSKYEDIKTGTGGVTENPWPLVAMSRVLNIIFKLFVGIPVYDVSNSFRLYRGDLLRSISPTYANFDVLEEILAMIMWGKPEHSATILEIPFRFGQRKYGKPKRNLIVFGIQFMTALFKLRLLRSKYRA